MEAFIMYALFIVGILLIVWGSNWFVDSSSWIAEATGIPKFIVGATIVSFATTLPEIVISVIASIDAVELLRFNAVQYAVQSQEMVGMAIGNSVGSLICNTALIMGLGIIFVPTTVEKRKITPKSLLLLLSVGALFATTYSNGSLSTRGASVLFIIFVIYIVESFKSGKNEIDTDDDSESERDKKLFIKNILLMIIGAGCIFGGSELVVNYGSEIARSLGVSEAVIGATFVAVGTSLPELITAIVAIIKKQPTISLGNIIGANIMDTMLILPLCAIIYGGKLPVSDLNIWFEFPMAILMTVIAVIPTLIARRFRRWQGIVLILLYLVYLTVITVGGESFLSAFGMMS